MLVRELENRLLGVIPSKAAEEWDRTGMLVGNPDATVGNVAVSLDPSIAALDFCMAHDANVLVTHHPLFLDPPQSVKPGAPNADAVGARIWQAVRNGISVISFHTALDANPLAANVLAAPLGLEAGNTVLESTPNMPGYGYGRICEAPTRDAASWLASCEAAFGRKARLWGSEDREIRRICLWTGAAGESPQACLEAQVDLLICGEVKYHTALDASEMGLSIVELGHDVSEQPHCALLVESLLRAGIPAESVFLMDLPVNWR